MKPKTKYSIFGISLVLLVLAFAVNFPHTIKAPCVLTPIEEWALIQIETDKLLSKLIDNYNEKVHSYTLLQFDRQDFVKFNSQAAGGQPYFIRKGDPIANLYSTNNQMRLANLLADLEISFSARAMVSSGEKTALQEEVKQALNMARIELNAFEPQYQRKKQLFEQDLIGAEELEIAQSTYKLYQINVDREDARLKAIQSGEKTEVILYYEAEMKQIREQIELLKNKMDMEVIKSPLNGIFSGIRGDSLICQVERIDTLLIKIPVAAAELKYVEPGQILTIYIQETGNTYTAAVINIGQRSQLINGILKYLITGRIENNHNELLPGMSGLARIHCADVTLFKRLRRDLQRYSEFSL